MKEKPVPTRTILIEDQGLMRAFLERWLDGMPGYTRVLSVSTAEEALACIEEVPADLAIVDYQLPGLDGLEFARSARQIRPQLRVLVISTLIDPLALTRIHESGVEGFVEKDASPELLAEAVGAVSRGERFFSPMFQQTLATEGARSESVGKILSRREQQVLSLLLGGKTNREIADHIGLSVRTVEFHRANLMAKLDTKNLADLEAVACLRGWK